MLISFNTFLIHLYYSDEEMNVSINNEITLQLNNQPTNNNPSGSKDVMEKVEA